MVRPQAEPYTGIPRPVNPYQTNQLTNDDFTIPKEKKNRALTKIESKETFLNN